MEESISETIKTLLKYEEYSWAFIKLGMHIVEKLYPEAYKSLLQIENPDSQESQLLHFLATKVFDSKFQEI